MITLTSNVNKAFDTVKGLAWIVKLTLDDATRYWSSENITISSQEYVGRFILQNGVDSIDSLVDTSIGGGLASIGNTSLSLNEIITQNGLHRDFKPQSAGTELINRAVEIGCVYNFGSLSTTDIVWLYSGVIDDFNYSIDKLNLDVVAAREIDSLNLPRETVNTADYPNAPEESLGLPIPILYGDFIAGNTEYSDAVPCAYIRACPTVCINKNDGIFYASSHVCHSVNPSHFYHDGQMSDFAIIMRRGGISTQYNIVGYGGAFGGHAYLTVSGGRLVAYCFMRLSFAGENNDVTSFENIINRDFTDSADVTNTKKLSLMLDGYPTGEIISAVQIGWQRLVTTSESWAIGYAADGTYTDVTVYTTSATASGRENSLILAGQQSSILSKYEWVIDCSGVGESLTDVNLFWLEFAVFLDSNVSKPIIKRATVRTTLQQPRISSVSIRVPTL